MARVLIEVDDPLGLSSTEDDPVDGPLLLDSYVDLVIEGAETRSLFELPREWLRDGSKVWIYSGQQLEVRPVDVVWRFEDTVCIDRGLSDGDLVVTSRIATPIAGMKLRHGDERAGDLPAPTLGSLSDEHGFDEHSFDEHSFDEHSFDEHSFDEQSADGAEPQAVTELAAAEAAP